MSPIRRLRKRENAFVNNLSASSSKRIVHTATLAVIIIQLTILIWYLDTKQTPWHPCYHNRGVNSNEALTHFKRHIKYEMSSRKREHLTLLWRIFTRRTGISINPSTWVFCMKQDFHVELSNECRHHTSQQVIYVPKKCSLFRPRTVLQRPTVRELVIWWLKSRMVIIETKLKKFKLIHIWKEFVMI